MKQRPQQICHVMIFTNLALSRSIQASAKGMDVSLDGDAGVIPVYVNEQDAALH